MSYSRLGFFFCFNLWAKRDCSAFHEKLVLRKILSLDLIFVVHFYPQANTKLHPFSLQQDIFLKNPLLKDRSKNYFPRMFKANTIS